MSLNFRLIIAKIIQINISNIIIFKIKKLLNFLQNILLNLIKRLLNFKNHQLLQNLILAQKISLRGQFQSLNLFFFLLNKRVKFRVSFSQFLQKYSKFFRIFIFRSQNLFNFLFTFEQQARIKRIHSKKEIQNQSYHRLFNLFIMHSKLKSKKIKIVDLPINLIT